MPRKNHNSDAKPQDGSLRKVATILAILGSLVGLILKWPAIQQFISPKTVEFRYVRVDEPRTVQCIVESGMQLKLNDKQSIPVEENECFTELESLMSVSVLKEKGEQVGRATFLEIDNKGNAINRLEVVADAGNVELGQLPEGGSVLVCLGYEGKSGGRTRSSVVHQLKLFREQNGTPKLIAVPSKPQGMAGYSDGNCGTVMFGDIY